MLRVVMVQPLQVQVLLPDLMFLRRSVQLIANTVINDRPVLRPLIVIHGRPDDIVLLTHHSEQVQRWLTVQLMTKLKCAVRTRCSLDDVALELSRRGLLWLDLGLASDMCQRHFRILYNWMLVEGLWRVVLDKVARHRLHQFDNFGPGSIVAKNSGNFTVEIFVMQKALEKRVVLFFQSLNQVL